METVSSGEAAICPGLTLRPHAASSQHRASRLSSPRGVGVFGGTFDPVHRGHVASIVDFRDRLSLARVLVIPAGVPPHRDTPASSGAQRLEMLRRAFEGETRLEIDYSELQRSGRSCMVDTLASIREELGASEPLLFALGMDAYLTLPTWHKWEALTRFAHIVALARPGIESVLPPVLQAWEAGRRVAPDALLDSAAGCIVHLKLSQLDVSATAVRDRRGAGSDWRNWLTPAGADYIETRGRYLQSPDAGADDGGPARTPAEPGRLAGTPNPA